MARNDQFKQLGKDICLQIVATSPKSISPDGLSSEFIESEKNIIKAQVGNKPNHIVDKIIEGKMNKIYQQNCLLKQQFVKNNDITIQQLLSQYILSMKENIVIRRYSLFKI